MKVMLRKNSNKNTQIWCRIRDDVEGHHRLPKDSYYITVIGFISGGRSASFPICIDHVDEFFDQVANVKREINKIKNKRDKRALLRKMLVGDHCPDGRD